MGPDRGGVEHEPLQVRLLKRREDALPAPPCGPAAEPSGDRVPVAVALGQVAPGSAASGDPDDGVDEEPVVPGRGAGIGGFAGEQVLNPLPLLVGDLIASGRHGLSSTDRMDASQSSIVNTP